MLARRGFNAERVCTAPVKRGEWIKVAEGYNVYQILMLVMHLRRV